MTEVLITDYIYIHSEAVFTASIIKCTYVLVFLH